MAASRPVHLMWLRRSACRRLRKYASGLALRECSSLISSVGVSSTKTGALALEKPGFWFWFGRSVMRSEMDNRQ